MSRRFGSIRQIAFVVRDLDEHFCTGARPLVSGRSSFGDASCPRASSIAETRRQHLV
jgi:hypothetical protein